MRILIGIPVYNEAKYINSVLSEVCKYNDDILIVDDGSTDLTPALLAGHKVEVIRHSENRGYGRFRIPVSLSVELAFSSQRVTRFDHRSSLPSQLIQYRAYVSIITPVLTFGRSRVRTETIIPFGESFLCSRRASTSSLFPLST